MNQQIRAAAPAVAAVAVFPPAALFVGLLALGGILLLTRDKKPAHPEKRDIPATPPVAPEPQKPAPEPEPVPDAQQSDQGAT